MRTMTLEAIRENPWNVITTELPDPADPVLLEAAVLAADYCRSSEFLIVKAVRLDLYRPPGLKHPSTYSHDQWHELEKHGEFAHDAYRVLCDAYVRMFGRSPV